MVWHISPVIILILICSACTDDFTEYRSACGVVVDKEVQNPAGEGFAEHVTISSITGANLLTVRNDDGKARLVILHGTKSDASSEKDSAAQNFLRSLGDSASFFQADEECTIRVGDSDLEAVPGQIINHDGKSYSEELLMEGLIEVETRNVCSSDLLRNCYQALLEESRLN